MPSVDWLPMRNILVSISPSVRQSGGNRLVGSLWSGRDISLLLLSSPDSDNMIQHVIAVILLSVEIRAETFTIGYLAGNGAERESD